MIANIAISLSCQRLKIVGFCICLEAAEGSGAVWNPKSEVRAC
jgi:hypothetical protein